MSLNAEQFLARRQSVTTMQPEKKDGKETPGGKGAAKPKAGAKP